VNARRWGIIALIAVGVVVLAGVVAATGNGRDNSGERVSPSRWADDSCGSVGAWEGQLEAIRDELSRDNYGARRNDGGSGDIVEARLTIRVAVDRAILATTDVLQEGLKRAGIPDVGKGEEASLTLRNWAQQTEHNLRVAKQVLKEKPPSTSQAFGALRAPVDALTLSVVQGRAAFSHVTGLDPALGDALDGSRNCRDLMKEQP